MRAKIRRIRLRNKARSQADSPCAPSLQRQLRELKHFSEVFARFLLMPSGRKRLNSTGQWLNMETTPREASTDTSDGLTAAETWLRPAADAKKMLALRLPPQCPGWDRPRPSAEPSMPHRSSKIAANQNGFQVDCGVNLRYPMLAPSRSPTPERIGTTTTLLVVSAVMPSPPMK